MDATSIIPLRTRLCACLRSGALAGARQALWLLAIMIPISLGVTLLNYWGALAWLAGGVEPMMGLAGLPGESAASIITAAALNIYSGIAALGPLALTDRQVTVLAFFMLSFHNLPVELAVQRKVGSSARKIFLLRLGTAVAGALLLNALMPLGEDSPQTRGQVQPLSNELGAVLRAWSIGSTYLTGKVTVLVVALMILQKVLAEFGIARYLARVLYPLLLLLGLPRRTAFLWITMNTLGLAYGGAVLVEESKSGELSREDIERLNRSAAVCHSLLEDTLLFVAIGAWTVWIVLPRLVLAAVAVWSYRAWSRLSEGWSEPTQSTEAQLQRADSTHAG